MCRCKKTAQGLCNFAAENQQTNQHNPSMKNNNILKFRSGNPDICPLMFEGNYVRFRDFPVIGEPVIIDSKMNAEIRPNDNCVCTSPLHIDMLTSP